MHTPDTAKDPVAYDISFRLHGSDKQLTVRTARPDWLYGASFIGLPASFATGTAAYAVNPVNGETIPLIRDDAITGGPLLGVAAHDSTARRIADRHGLRYSPVIAQDFGEPLRDAKDVFGVVVIGYDPQTDEYMGLLNGSMGWLAGGGRESGETYEECARRELAEEAGYGTPTTLISLGDPVYSYYYNDIKRSNRRSLGYNYLAVLDRNAGGSQRQEAHEDFTVWWTGFDELFASITQTGGGVGHWLEALRRARDAAATYVAGKPYITIPYGGEGVLIHSGPYDGMPTEPARHAILAKLRRQGAITEAC